MFWTGLGFWNGVANPMLRVSLNAAHWKDVSEFEEEYPLILEGTAFAVIAQTASLDKSRLEAIPGIRNDADLDWTYLGVGRTLWFLYTRNHAKLAEIMDALPDRAWAMARGLGIAVTLTQLDKPERVINDLTALPSEYRQDLLIGSVLAFICLMLDDARGLERLNHFPAPLKMLIAAINSNRHLFVGPGWIKRAEVVASQQAALWRDFQLAAPARHNLG
jgi:hypothetical protein